jgi:hypothetical protein
MTSPPSLLADAVQQGLTEDDYSLTGAVIAVSTIMVLQVGTTYVSFRISGFKRFFEGEPQEEVPPALMRGRVSGGRGSRLRRRWPTR